MSIKTDPEIYKRISTILESYFSGPIPEPIRKKILSWILHDGHGEEKDAALSEIWAEMYDGAQIDMSLIDELNEIRRLAGLSPSRILQVTGIRARNKPLVRRRIMLGVAAVLVPITMIVASLFLTDKQQAPASAIAVSDHACTDSIVVETRDETTTIELPDGSTVKLFPGSEIFYDEHFENHRIVALNGCALFNVTKNEDNPFIVKTDRLEVTVLGTEFMVSAYESLDKSFVSLHQGSVKVVAEQKMELTLSPGNSFEYQHGTGEALMVKSDPAVRTATGPNFNYVVLEEILRSVELTHGTPFIIDGTPSRKRYSINFEDSEKLEVVLTALEKLTGEFTYAIEGDKVKITINK